MNDDGFFDPDVSAETKGVQTLIEWFLKNYEDPVHSCPYDGAEGGYQYIWGGPIEDVGYELYEAFPDASEEDVLRATEILDDADCAGRWARVPRDEEAESCCDQFDTSGESVEVSTWLGEEES